MKKAPKIDYSKFINYSMDAEAYAPERAHETDAGFDLKTPKEVTVKVGEGVSINTGIHVLIPAGWYGKIESKSGLNVKHGIVCLGGVIDSGYTGKIVVKVYNFGQNDYTFNAGEKIAQMIIMPCSTLPLHETNLEMLKILNEGDRGDNGFGSTGR